MSMNCFSGNVKTLEVCVLHNYISFIISRKLQKENYSSLARRKRAPSFSNPNNFPLHRSLMWLQKGKLLTRWKERFIVITEEYIQCFKKGLAQLSQMGDFIFQVQIKYHLSSDRAHHHFLLILVCTEGCEIRVSGGQERILDSGAGD